jgi:hypothetical protein
VKIVCDCDRYRLSGLASAGLGRYVGYTVTKVGAGGGIRIVFFVGGVKRGKPVLVLPWSKTSVTVDFCSVSAWLLLRWDAVLAKQSPRLNSHQGGGDS